MGKKFGEYLKQCRLKKKIGLREMERLTEGKIKAPYLSRIESGRENPPGPERLEIIAKLLDQGVRPEQIGKTIYESNSFDKLKLLGYSLSEKLKVICDGKAAYIALTRKDLLDYNYRKGDTEGIVNYALSISGVNMAALIIETKDRIKFSFRSSGNFSVNKFANNYFNGGGHKNAAGGSIEDKLSVALDKFLESISKHKEELNY